MQLEATKQAEVDKKLQQNKEEEIKRKAEEEAKKEFEAEQKAKQRSATQTGRAADPVPAKPGSFLQNNIPTAHSETQGTIDLG